MSDEWYYSWSGTDHEGPATLDELRRLVKEGCLAPSHMVWREGMPKWVAAGGVQQLFPSEAPPMMAGWTERKQALHDMIAGTLVTRKNLPLGR